LRPQQQPLPTQAALQQLAALQQQQQLAQVLASDPLMSLTNLLAAQQGLSARVQELLLLKQQLQQVVPTRPSGHGGIRGTGPISNPLYKVSPSRLQRDMSTATGVRRCSLIPHVWVLSKGGSPLAPKLPARCSAQPLPLVVTVRHLLIVILAIRHASCVCADRQQYSITHACCCHLTCRLSFAAHGRRRVAVATGPSARCVPEG
jgi:hypothetical protein